VRLPGPVACLTTLARHRRARIRRAPVLGALQAFHFVLVTGGARVGAHVAIRGRRGGRRRRHLGGASGHRPWPLGGPDGMGGDRTQRSSPCRGREERRTDASAGKDEECQMMSGQHVVPQCALSLSARDRGLRRREQFLCSWQNACPIRGNLNDFDETVVSG